MAGSPISDSRSHCPLALSNQIPAAKALGGQDPVVLALGRQPK